MFTRAVFTIFCLATILASVLAGNAGQRKISVTTVNNQPVQAGELIFEENFDVLNFTTWQHERTLSGGGNWEFQVYDNSRTNSYVKDGILYIKPTLTEDRYGPGFVTTGTLEMYGGTPADECTNPSFYGCSRMGVNGAINPAMSARIRTVNSFNFKYGKVEVRAKIPTGDWLWPAIWLLPRHNAYGLWPASGEIDLLEARGNARLMNNGVNIGVEQVSSTLHFGPYWPLDGYEKATYARNSVPGYNTDFHLYQLEWTPEYLQVSLDNVVMGKVVPPAGGFFELGGFAPEIENPWRFSKNKIAPFDEEFYFIVNLAVGGTNGYFPDTAVNEGAAKPWASTSPRASNDFWNAKDSWYSTWKAAGEDASLQVDYIKVWSL